MLLAALTRLMAEAFCSAAPLRLTLDMFEEVTVDPSTAMFCAAAEASVVAPSTVLITWLDFVSSLYVESAFCRLMLAAVLVAKASVLVVLFSVAELLAELDAL
jgi:hypothetical protein